MSPRESSDHAASFVIRLWLEREGEDTPEWRWHVLHIQSHHERYGRRLEDLMRFIGEQSGVRPPGAPGSDSPAHNHPNG